MKNASASEDPVESQLLAVLEKYWGYDKFLPLQREAMRCGVEGRDSVVVLPTGGGKSLCYQAPALVREGLTLVVSPLISLMKDQVDTLVAGGVPAACVNSTLSVAEKKLVAERSTSGELKLLYVAPERLLADRTLDFLARSNLTMAAIDEAHCISAWGHDFRPEYRGLRVLKERFPQIGVHAFTATASEQVRRDIAEQLQLDKPEFLIGSFDRPNLVYTVERANNRFGQICEVIERHAGESGIVYCISRKEVDKTAAGLAQLGHKALPYHAGLTDVERHENQDAFIREEAHIIVATVAFGMGIDKSNVRYVVHAGMPKSLEHYQQESGRAGRDGLEAECKLIFSGNDYATWTRLIDGGSAKAGAMKALGSMQDFCNSVTCRHRAIVEYFGQTLVHENCGACDVCLGDLDLVAEPLIVGQKILSCVARLKERFGADYTAKVLAGSAEQRILEQGHDQLSTYGLLKNEGARAIRDWIEQLVSQECLAKTGDYNTLTLTDRGRQLLRGEVTPRLLQPAEKQSAKPVHDAASWEGVDRGLFENLRVLRKQLADERGWPAYVVFGDATLRDMARLRPTTDTAMRRVRGVGEKKLADYGEIFMARIADYCAEHALATSVRPATPAQQPAAVVDRTVNSSSVPAFAFFRQGLSVAEVAQQMNRAISTVGGYLGDYLRYEKITDPTPWVSSELAARIEKAALATDLTKFRPIFDALEGQATYEEIRVVVTCLQNRRSDADCYTPGI